MNPKIKHTKNSHKMKKKTQKNAKNKINAKIDKSCLIDILLARRGR
jgi:hypothetical protein